MVLINRLLNRLFEAGLQPFTSLPILGSLAVVSLLTAIAMLLVARVAANQKGLKEARRQIYADLFEIRLFKDEGRAMLRSQASMFRHTARYLALALTPALWTLAPLALAVAQLQSYFGYTGVEIGQPVLVSATFKARDAQDVRLDAPEGTHLDTPAILFPRLRQVIWRVVVDSAGDHVLRLHTGGTTYEKTLHASNRLARRSPLRPSARLIDEVLYPSEVPLADSAPLSSIEVAYPERRIDVFGLHASWIHAYAVLSLAFWFLLKGFANVLPLSLREWQ